jgi:branched-chain amino acid transport system substrate-binding protein
MLVGVVKRSFFLFGLALGIAFSVQAQAPTQAPVFIGIDEAYSIKTNTAPRAIERGAQAAIAEINARGGVLGGRPLQLLTTDNQSLPARGRDNLIDLAAKPGLIAVLAGKFSPVTVEMIPEANRQKVPVISVWGSADPITEGAVSPSFAFRLSLKDSWGVEAMMLRAKSVHRATRQCAILPNTAWGRSADAVLVAKAGRYGISVVATHWYNWGETLFHDALAECAHASAQSILLVANEREAASIVSQLAELPQNARLPVVAHWGMTGGVMHQLAGPALEKVDMQVIQTFTFIGNTRPAAGRLAQWILRDAQLSAVEQIPSPVGSAHAYDMTHLLALAVNKAGSTRGDDIRKALESLPPFEGAVRRYAPAFTATSRDALTAREVLFVRMRPSGELTPVR